MIIFVLNNNTEMTDDEIAILKKIENKNYITIINKIDLDKKIDDSKLNNVIYMSTLKNIGIDELKKKIS